MSINTDLLRRNDGKKYTTLILGGMHIDAIENSIKENKDMEHSTHTHIGFKASDTKFIGEDGRKLTFKSIVHALESSQEGNDHRIQDYKNLSDVAKKTPSFLVSNSYAKYNGKYVITKFDVEEDSGGTFNIDWELQEVITAPVTMQTFRVWGKAPTTKPTPPTNTASKASANTTHLLTKCPTMSRKEYGTRSGVDCVKRLQIFMQAGGYYLRGRLDGNFGPYTESELKRVQSTRKLTQTGVWDNTTITFYKKLYGL